MVDFAVLVRQSELTKVFVKLYRVRSYSCELPSMSNNFFARYDRKYKETQQRMEELGLMEQSPVLHLDEWEIPRENIVLNRKLGEGAFGAVCGGEVIGLRGEGEWIPVAVKSLKIGSLPEDKV